MPLQHIFWRLSEGHTTAFPVRITLRCELGVCEVDRVDVIMELDPIAPKPETAACPLCRRAMRVLSAVRVQRRS